LIGDATKAKKIAGLGAEGVFEELIVMMVEGDLRAERGILNGTRGAR
jgi:GDP-D-mannose dehydratase